MDTLTNKTIISYYEQFIKLNEDELIDIINEGINESKQSTIHLLENIREQLCRNNDIFLSLLMESKGEVDEALKWFQAEPQDSFVLNRLYNKTSQFFSYISGRQKLVRQHQYLTFEYERLDNLDVDSLIDSIRTYLDNNFHRIADFSKEHHEDIKDIVDFIQTIGAGYIGAHYGLPGIIIIAVVVLMIKRGLNIAGKWEKNQTLKRRPPINFYQMGIKRGEILKCRGTGDSVQVISHRKVLLGNQEYSLTAITNKLFGNPQYYTIDAKKWWTYNGRNLNEIYEETYPRDQY